MTGYAGTNGGLGSSIQFRDNSADYALVNVVLYGDGTGSRTNASLDISQDKNGAVEIGSLAGGGNVFLGSNSLDIDGSVSVAFSGIFQDGGIGGGVGGSLTKGGAGTFTLEGANTYTGSTTIDAGILSVNNNGTTTLGALGTGPVYVNTAGTLEINSVAGPSSASPTTPQNFYIAGPAQANAASSGVLEFNADGSAGGANITYTITGGQAAGGVPGTIDFFGNGTAGSATFNNDGGTISNALGGLIQFGFGTAGNGLFHNYPGTAFGASGGVQTFADNADAGNSIIINYGAAYSGSGNGTLFFQNSATAQYAAITNLPGTASSAPGGRTTFLQGSSAGHGTIISEGATVAGASAGETLFSDPDDLDLTPPTGGSATLIANGGTGGNYGGAIEFQDDSTGGSAAVQVYGNGYLDISDHDFPGMSIGSLEGTGNVFLGYNRLTVGGAGSFSGSLKDGGPTGIGSLASLVFNGSGTFLLTGVNTYTGPTTAVGGFGAGVLQFGKRTALYDGASSYWTASQIIVENGGTLALNVGGDGEFDTSDISQISAMGTTSGGFENGSTLCLDTTDATGGNFVYPGSIANTNGGANSIGLTKIGSGTLTLTGDNTYTGPTTVAMGALAIDYDGVSTFGTLGGGLVNVLDGATLHFLHSASAASNNILGGNIVFSGNSTAAAASISINGGSILFEDNSSGGTASVGLQGPDDFLDISLHSSGSLSIGSLNGTGNIFLGSNNLSVGGNNDDSYIYGVISDGGIGAGTDGSLTKTGAGTLVLAGANTFTGTATVNAGTLEVQADGINTFGTLGAGAATVNSQGTLEFVRFASAGSGEIASVGASNPGAPGGITIFGADSSAGSAVLIATGGNNGGGGGEIQFLGNSTGGTAAVKLYGIGGGDPSNGGMDISQNNNPSTSIGSLEGDGNVFLGSNNLAIGGNDNTTTFSGIIQDLGAGGSLTKVGSGPLTLSGQNTYTGVTTLGGGVLNAGSAEMPDTR
jgi:fibronectin-binding autotransporter adhesin